jgi:DNA primase
VTHKSQFEHPRLQVNVPALLDALDIQVAKREGRTLYALCPFHNDTRPTSWSIVDNPGSSRNGFMYCFACQNGGGAVALVRHVRGFTTEQAVEWLKSGNLERELPLEVDVVVGQYSAGARLGMRVPSEVKVRPFEDWPTSARRYLDERRITAAQVVRYDLGFALEGRLAGRVVFPMKDRLDRVVSYTARDFTGQGKRYLEPLTSEGAQKGALFGEHLWTSGSKILAVAEGCPDALALDRVAMRLDGVPLYDVCALHGSRLHPSQAAKFSRYERVVVATDPDPAGDAVALEIEQSLGRYSIVLRARPPEKQDCASMPIDELAWLIPAALDHG